MPAKKRTEEIREAREEIARLSRRLDSIREEERARISRQVHDGLGQHLFALKMELTSLVSQLQVEVGPIRERVDSIFELIETSLAAVHEISCELRSTVLDSFGLPEAMRRGALRFEEHTGVSCDLRVDPIDLELDPELSLALLRIFQEALTNVARHADATKVIAFLTLDDGELALRISDDGKGIADDDVTAPSSLGLVGMRERLLPFDGRLDISGAPGRGTEIAVEVEIERAL